MPRVFLILLLGLLWLAVHLEGVESLVWRTTTSPWTTRSDTVDARNQIDTIKTEHTGGPTAGTTTQARHDAAGNLTFDGEYWYQYDAWNRLVQINAAHE